MKWLDTGADLMESEAMDDESEAEEMEYGSQSKRQAEFESKKGKVLIQFKKKSTYKRDTATVHNRSTDGEEEYVEVWKRRILVPRRSLEGEDRREVLDMAVRRNT